MDLTFGSQFDAFRSEVRQFINGHLPHDIRNKVIGGRSLGKDDFLRWHKILFRKGWVAGSWPTEVGGAGWSHLQQLIFEEECADADAPRLAPFGLQMLGPVLIRFGTPHQQQFFLPRILSGEDWWCQGFSEPGAGSDIAAVSTRAQRQGNRYAVTGEKTWISFAHFADWIFCLVRVVAEAREQGAISLLLIDLRSPGVSIRPIRMLDGEHEINQVLFEDVSVPAENLVGKVGKGWTYARYLLANERAGIAGVGRLKRELTELKSIASKAVRSSGGPLIGDQRYRDRLAQVQIELMALELTNYRCLVGGDLPDWSSSMLKIRGAELRQAISELKLEALGACALSSRIPTADAGDSCHAAGPDWGLAITAQYFNLRKMSIFGGSNEIQRNLIAKDVLGL